MTSNPANALRAVLTVTVATRADGGHYFDQADFAGHVTQWVRAALKGKHAIGEVTITEQPAAASAVVSPPTDRAALRDRIAEALHQDQTPPPTVPWTDEAPMDREYFLRRADAVLAVLPEPPSRAAVLREAADIAESLRQFERVTAARWSAQVSENVGILRVVEHLRRVADEEQPAQCTCGGPNTTTTLPSGTIYEEHRVDCAVMAVDDEEQPAEAQQQEPESGDEALRAKVDEATATLRRIRSTIRTLKDQGATGYAYHQAITDDLAGPRPDRDEADDPSRMAAEAQQQPDTEAPVLVETLARLLCDADNTLTDGPGWDRLSQTPGLGRDEYRNAARYLLRRVAVTQTVDGPAEVLCGDGIPGMTCTLPDGPHDDWKHRDEQGHWWSQMRVPPYSNRDRLAAEPPV